MSKAALIDMVRVQTGVELQSDRGNTLNSNRNILYTQITRKDYYSVMNALRGRVKGIESHVDDYYFIIL